MNELVRELNNSTLTLTFDNASSNGSLSRSNSSKYTILAQNTPMRVFSFSVASTGVVPNDQIEADVQQLMDLMKTRKQQLEDLLSEKMKDFGLICVLENVRWRKGDARWKMKVSSFCSSSK